MVVLWGCFAWRKISNMYVVAILRNAIEWHQKIHMSRIPILTHTQWQILSYPIPTSDFYSFEGCGVLTSIPHSCRLWGISLDDHLISHSYLAFWLAHIFCLFEISQVTRVWLAAKIWDFPGLWPVIGWWKHVHVWNSVAEIRLQNTQNCVCLQWYCIIYGKKNIESFVHVRIHG